MSKKDAFKEYFELQAKYAEAQVALKAIKAELDEVEEELTKKIPEGKAMHGLTHVVTCRRNVSYKDVVIAIKENLVPKAKQDAVADVIEEYTSVSETHSIKVAKE